MREIEKFSIGIIVLLSIGVSLSDFFGLLDKVSWISERIPTYILLSSSMFYIYYIINASKNNIEVKKSLEKITSQISRKDKINFLGEIIEDIFSSKDNDINYIFSRLTQTKSEEELVEFSEKIYKELRCGNINSNFLGFSWDFSIAVISLNGNFLYHQEYYRDKRVSPANKTYAEILEKRNGIIDKKDYYRSEALDDVIDTSKIKNSRITRNYFKEHLTLKYIIVVESHINLIDRFTIK